MLQEDFGKCVSVDLNRPVTDTEPLLEEVSGLSSLHSLVSNVLFCHCEIIYGTVNRRLLIRETIMFISLKLFINILVYFFFLGKDCVFSVWNAEEESIQLCRRIQRGSLHSSQGHC